MLSGRTGRIPESCRGHSGRKKIKKRVVCRKWKWDFLDSAPSGWR
jgi:hypothetical protein